MGTDECMDVMDVVPCPLFAFLALGRLILDQNFEASGNGGFGELTETATGKAVFPLAA